MSVATDLVKGPQAARLAATAVAGPTGAAEYDAAAKQGIPSIKQAALSSAAASAGALDAPEAFKAAQATRLATPLDADNALMGARQGAAGTYKAALNSSQAAFNANLAAATPIVQKALAAKSAIYEQKYKDSIIAQHKKDDAELEASAKKQKDAADKQQTNFDKSQVEFARQDAAADPAIQDDEYAAIEDTLKHATDLETAKRYLKIKYPDADAASISAAMQYINQAFGPQFLTPGDTSQGDYIAQTYPGYGGK